MALSHADVKLVEELVASKVGKWYIARLQKDYDDTIRLLLFCPSDEVEVYRGKARSLFEQIQELNRCVRK